MVVARAQAYAVSIHASAREATWITRHPQDLLTRFNPRLRAGGDLLHVAVRQAAQPVSIHASAREATGMRLLEGKVTPVSIHASAREATL